jgi:predicted nucleic acid-binding protein
LFVTLAALFVTLAALFVTLAESGSSQEPSRTVISIGPLDLLIAAHARALRATLVTNNHKEFSRVPDFTVEDWS